MTTATRRLLGFVGRLHAIVGAPGLMIGVVAVFSFIFGLYVLTREYDRPLQTNHRSLHQVLRRWIRTPDYLGLTLVDHLARWREADPESQPARLERLRQALQQLGDELDRQAERFPLLHVTSMELRTPDRGPLARWTSTATSDDAGNSVDDIFPLRTSDTPHPAELRLSYHTVPALEESIRGLEVSYLRLLLGMLGLSGFSLLCLVYMVLNARALAERVAREAAQEATLDLADRTCHELGNGVFVLANERRNLAEHLDLVERFIVEETPARVAAAQRVGLDPDTAGRWHHALKREYAARGIDPDLELRGSAALARHVCRQIDVCSQYISQTVRELDGFLKHSALPLAVETIDVDACFDEVVALLRPRLDAAGAEVERPPAGSPRLMVRADRRLLVHALVNLVKNAVEAVESAGGVAFDFPLGPRRGALRLAGVSDNGPGIPPAALRKIFDHGYSTKASGRGRGLAIVRDSISLQNGQIVAENLPAGGARFRIGLDVDPGAA